MEKSSFGNWCRGGGVGDMLYVTYGNRSDFNLPKDRDGDQKSNPYCSTDKTLPSALSSVQNLILAAVGVKQNHLPSMMPLQAVVGCLL